MQAVLSVGPVQFCIAGGMCDAPRESAEPACCDRCCDEQPAPDTGSTPTTDPSASDVRTPSRESLPVCCVVLTPSIERAVIGHRTLTPEGGNQASPEAPATPAWITAALTPQQPLSIRLDTRPPDRERRADIVGLTAIRMLV